MIDFIRMNYKDKSEVESFICDSKNFEELRVVLEKHSGEIEYPYKTSLGSMEINITEKNIRVMNSLHKFYNQQNKKGYRNHNDFTYSQLTETIDLLNNGLIRLENARLSKLEFGLNIELDFPAEFIVKDNIMMHKYQTHNHNKKFNGKGEFKQFDHCEYDFKIYDKAKQYRLTKNVLRVEIKHKCSRSINSHGVFNINNLTSKESLQSLFENLMMRFEELTIIDNYKNSSVISEEVKKKIGVYTSYNHWESLKSSSNLRNKAMVQKAEFKQLLEDNNLLNTKNLLRDKLNTKFQYLINN
ncbi:conserved hypothetical protein [Tenacibaculum maritimum]|uniref:hypothetical protein n=1 Tax=Tenacibaculum maritimum TaxID=107401 RepID=UPI0012E6ABCD|nr:hypothetical protein [Tenacibaculum maritimum]CAA0253096.1 conserved hypothetical protein [Tenacibaculum maritimum]